MGEGKFDIMPELYTTVQDGTDTAGELTDIMERLDKNKYFSEAMFGVSNVDNRKMTQNYDNESFGGFEETEQQKIEGGAVGAFDTYGPNANSLNSGVLGGRGRTGAIRSLQRNDGSESTTQNIHSIGEMLLTNDWQVNLSDVDDRVEDYGYLPKISSRIKNTENKMTASGRPEHGQHFRYMAPYKGQNTLG